MRRQKIASLIALSMLLSANASAHRVTRIDANDTVGKLDILKTTVDHPARLVLTTSVTGILTRRDFAGANHMGWVLDTKADDALDYWILLDAVRRGGVLRMRCALIDLASSAPEDSPSVRGRIKGHKGICAFRPSRLDGGLPEHWKARTQYEEQQDDAPNAPARTFGH